MGRLIPAVSFPDENSESESDSDDRFKGETWCPLPAMAAWTHSAFPSFAYVVLVSHADPVWRGQSQASDPTTKWEAIGKSILTAQSYTV